MFMNCMMRSSKESDKYNRVIWKAFYNKEQTVFLLDIDEKRQLSKTKVLLSFVYAN